MPPDVASTATSIVSATDKTKSSWTASIRRYLTSAAWRFGGAGIGAIGAIIAARRLGPEKLGVSGVVQSILTVAMLFVVLGQDLSLVRNYRNESDAKLRHAIVNEVFWGRLLISLFIGLLILIIGCLSDTKHLFLVAAFPAFALLVLQTTTPAWIFQATDDVPAQQRFLAMQSALGTVLIALILFPFPIAGLDLLAQASALAVVWVFMWRYAWKRHAIAPFTRVHLNNYLKRSLSNHWLISSSVVIYIYVSSQQLLVAQLCSIKELGLYRPALQVVQAIYPFLTLIPAILYPRLIDWAKEGPRILFQRQLQLMLFFSALLIPALAIAFFAFPLVFPKIFGIAFAAGALPCAILLTSKGFVVLNSLFTWGLWAQQRDRSMLVITSLVAVFSLILNFILIPRFGAIAASSIACVSEIGVLCGSIFLSWWNLNRKEPV